MEVLVLRVTFITWEVKLQKICCWRAWKQTADTWQRCASLAGTAVNKHSQPWKCLQPGQLSHWPRPDPATLAAALLWSVSSPVLWPVTDLEAEVHLLVHGHFSAFYFHGLLLSIWWSVHAACQVLFRVMAVVHKHVLRAVVSAAVRNCHRPCGSSDWKLILTVTEAGGSRPEQQQQAWCLVGLLPGRFTAIFFVKSHSRKG